jgi:hypothetical protein
VGDRPSNRPARYAVLRDDSRHVVGGAACECAIDERLASPIKAAGFEEDRPDALVVHHVRQPVGAEQQAVIVLQPDPRGLDGWSTGSPADGVGQERMMRFYRTIDEFVTKAGRESQVALLLTSDR